MLLPRPFPFSIFNVRPFGISAPPAGDEKARTVMKLPALQQLVT